MTSILFSEMTPGPDWEARFNEWYDTDHIPVRMVLKGFDGTQRYRAAEGGSYLVIYDLASLAALKAPEYQEIKESPSAETKWMLSNVGGFTRFLGDEIGSHGKPVADMLGAPVILATMFDVPEGELADFDDWMTQDHIPLLLKGSEWLGARRFSLSVGEPKKYTRLTVHYLGSPKALASEERTAARNTEWRRKMTERPWFNNGWMKMFHKHGDRFLSHAGAGPYSANYNK